MASNPKVNAGADIEKELAEKLDCHIMPNGNWTHLESHFVIPRFIVAALLAEAGERKNCVELLRACHKRNDTLGEALEAEAERARGLERKLEEWKRKFEEADTRHIRFMVQGGPVVMAGEFDALKAQIDAQKRFVQHLPTCSKGVVVTRHVPGPEQRTVCVCDCGLDAALSQLPTPSAEPL